MRATPIDALNRYCIRSASNPSAAQAPSFYILKDGQVTATLTGWPDDSQLDRLRQMVDAAD